MFTEPRPRRTIAVSIVLILAAAVPLFLLGRLTAPTDPPIRTEAGVPVGFPQNPEGAQAAARAFAAARARATLLEPQRRRELLGAIATAPFAAAADREDEQRDLAPLSDQDAGRYLVTALSSHLADYDGDGAAVMVWLFQVWAADAAVGSFSTQSVELAWDGDRWRLSRQAEAPVQAVPEVVQQPRHADTRRLMRERDRRPGGAQRERDRDRGSEDPLYWTGF